MVQLINEIKLSPLFTNCKKNKKQLKSDSYNLLLLILLMQLRGNS